MNLHKTYDQRNVTFEEENIITANITFNFHFTGVTLINIQI